MRREAGDGGGLVVEAGDHVAKVKGIENKKHVAVRPNQAQVAPASAQRSEIADDGAEARTVKLNDVLEIEKDVQAAGVDELPQLRAQFVVGPADGGLALKVQYSDAAGMPD